MRNSLVKSAVLVFAIATVGFIIYRNSPFTHSSDLASTADPEETYYQGTVRPVLEARCVACHGCYSAPCQMNLQSIEGLKRGSYREDVYKENRTSSTHPTRMGIDANSKEVWRSMGFTEVLDNGILPGLLAAKRNNPNLAPLHSVQTSRVCPATPDLETANLQKDPGAGMPFGHPPISEKEEKTIIDWIVKGTPGRDLALALSPDQKELRLDWESFLNLRDNEHRLLARYLYEHFFLAHIYFGPSADPSKPTQFFRLIRSSQACNSPVEIATPRPNDDPQTLEFNYCLLPYRQSIVAKNHIPYLMSSDKLKWIENNFFAKPWDSTVTELPTYDPKTATNPFITYKEIPAEARYKFLLEDAYYEVSTFIKGPVCSGAVAVNTIQEQFYVFFLDPKADPFALKPEFARAVENKLLMPGAYGREVKLDAVNDLEKIVADRNSYRKIRVEYALATRPQGYSKDDIWNGDGNNDNAALTVFRHYDNAHVMKGLRGDISKTVFVLDYAIFERLVYNLVVNFDVYGNIGHQVLTRTYMAMLRMEAEELFLSFLPYDQRVKLREEWYQGPFTALKMHFVYPELGRTFGTNVTFNNPDDAKNEFINMLASERFSAAVRGPADPINWSQLKPVTVAASGSQEALLQPLVNVVARIKPFSQFLPDLALLGVTDGQGIKKVYSIVHHKQMFNLAWMFAEEERRNTAEDSLTILPGVAGEYPNLFFIVNESQLASFSNTLRSVKNKADYAAFVKTFGVDNMAPNFWSIYDQFQAQANRLQGIEAGVLDLTRYE